MPIIRVNSWQEWQIDALQRLWGLPGFSASRIAKILGNKTRNAVIGKAHRLKLSKLKSPIISPEPLPPLPPLSTTQDYHRHFQPITGISKAGHIKIDLKKAQRGTPHSRQENIDDFNEFINPKPYDYKTSR